jgi:hypothetical protein
MNTAVFVDVPRLAAAQVGADLRRGLRRAGVCHETAD